MILREVHARRSVRDGERCVSCQLFKMLPCATAERLDRAQAKCQQIRGRRSQFRIPEWELLRRATSLLCDPIAGQAA